MGQEKQYCTYIQHLYTLYSYNTSQYYIRHYAKQHALPPSLVATYAVVVFSGVATGVSVAGVGGARDGEVMLPKAT